MAQEFDTVSDVRSWLSDEEPTAEEIESAIEIERDGPERKTALRALNSYLEDLDSESDDGGSGVEYRVERPFSGYQVGDIDTFDPDDERTQELVRDGHLRRWL